MALIYTLAVGPSKSHDVVERRLTTEVNGELREEKVYSPSETSLGEISLKQDDNVVLSLVDVDDAGNVSEPAVLAFIAKDTLPPDSPESFTIALIREEPDGTPTPGL